MGNRLKILQVCAVGATPRYLLRPLIDRLQSEGHTVHTACSPDAHAAHFEQHGYRLHPVPIARSVLAWSHPKSFWQLVRLMRRERYDVVHVHTPVAAVLGRLAAKLAGVPHILYTAHGFYFHERMSPWLRRTLIWVEKILGRCCTDWLLCQSQEDAEAAVREGIMPQQRTLWIGNGVDVQRFANARRSEALCGELGLDKDDLVIGFIGRLVGEKGILELFQALVLVREALPQTRLLVVGDTLDSDRDQRTLRLLEALIVNHDLAPSVVFAGQRQDIPELLQCMDVFALPSYREGMPRSVIEAMAAGLPVVATDIRGCREEVVDGQTGLLVPVADPDALANALIRLLKGETQRNTMGAAAQRRAQALFDESQVLDREMALYANLLQNS